MKEYLKIAGFIFCISVFVGIILSTALYFINRGVSGLIKQEQDCIPMRNDAQMLGGYKSN